MPKKPGEGFYNSCNKRGLFNAWKKRLQLIGIAVLSTLGIWKQKTVFRWLHDTRIGDTNDTNDHDAFKII